MLRVTILTLSLLAISGCVAEDTDTTELSMNVRVYADSVGLYAREVARDCTCTAGEWPEIGDCISSSDGVSCTCDPAPASCIEAVRVERDGQIVAQAGFAAEYGSDSLSVTDVLATTGNVLVIEGCGGVAEIPLDVASVPVPTIDSVTDDGSNVRVEWTSAPAAASAAIGAGDGFGGETCHASGAGGTSSFVSYADGFTDTLYVSVHAFAPAVTHDTELGTARVWAGDSVRQSLPL